MINRLSSRKSIYLIFIATSIFIFGFFPAVVQKYYSEGLYLYLSSALRLISSLFPFAVGDVIYALLIGFVFFRIFRFIKKRKLWQKKDRIHLPLQVLNFILLLYIIFKWAWGLNYSRPSVSEELKIGHQKYTVKELILLGNYFTDKTNELKIRQVKDRLYSTESLTRLSKQAYDLMGSKNKLFQYPNPCIKAVTSPWLISKMGIEGYYAPLSGEANLNMNLPEFVLPYVSCHEIAHQLGIAYEDEANLLGYLTAANSPDVNYQYAANYEMLRYILLEIRMKAPEDYKVLRNRLSAGVLNDFKIEKEFWRKYNGEMSGYMDVAFDRFLKLNHQQKGIDSYQDIVIWLWNIHQSEIRKTEIRRQ